MGYPRILVLVYRFLYGLYATVYPWLYGYDSPFKLQNINPEFHPMLMVAAGGAALIALWYCFCRYPNLRQYPRPPLKTVISTGDPWGGRTLEWSISSPAPFYNFCR